LVLRLKKEIINEFPALKENRYKFSYEMVFGRSEEEIIEVIKKMIRDKNFIPILMFLHKDG